jgi:8-oxo-dGTP pyrophosphatase MutT (NUDIX family)
MNAASSSALSLRRNPIRTISSGHETSARRIRVPQLRKARECERVAAVCYRLRDGAMQFLLIQTRGSRRWTFPKGKAEPGLTHAQAAAMEAFEEAGVHGRIEEACFARYFCGVQSQAKKSDKPSLRGLAVSAHLCEVLRLGSPKESGRNRTWFCTQDAKLKLREGRGREEAKEFARVIDKAVKSIERVQEGSDSYQTRPISTDYTQDELRRVQFEPVADYRWSKKPLRPYFRPGSSRVRNAIELTGLGSIAGSTPCDVLPFHSLRGASRSPKLLSAAKKLKS